MPAHAASPSNRRGPGRWLLIGVFVTVLVAAGLLVVNGGERSDTTVQGSATTAAGVPPPTSSQLVPPPPVPMVTDTAPADGVLRSEFETQFGETAGQIGIVLLPVGAGVPVVLGEWQVGAAWSTSKVPLSIAALRESPPAETGLVTSAITASDNASAEALWSGLGDPQTAAGRVEQVLRDADDPTTVQSQRVAGEQFSAFGQTLWSLENQARFMAWMACHTDAPEIATVWDLMGRISSDQRWGLGGIDGTRFKGGWGPSGAGYLVRQLGVIDQSGRLTAVAIASDSGSFGSGTGDLDAIATFLTGHLPSLPKGACPAA